MSTAIGSGLGFAITSALSFEKAFASISGTEEAPHASGERMAAAEGSRYRAYRSQSGASPNVSTWVQIDLGESQKIEAIKLYPAKTHLLAGEGFPLRFLIECSDEPSFARRQLIANHSRADYPDPDDHIVQFAAKGARARYVRLTATRLRAGKVPAIFYVLPKSMLEPVQKEVATSYVFSLAKIEVMSGGVDMAIRRPVSVDAAYGDLTTAQQLTRAPRPQGEGIRTDQPHNVSTPLQWQPVPYRAQAPRTGLQVQGGLFRTALENNIRYLLDSNSMEDLLRPFRLRAGKAVPASTREPNPFWDDALAGSNAGRFLMGAANTLHWIEHEELRRRLNEIVAGIAEYRQPNGYIMGYPEDTFFFSERGAYTRSWLTHGLLDAGYAGQAQAFELLRGYYDWYNRSAYLPEALRGCIQGGQGMVANSRLYFSPVGTSADLQVLQRYFQENYWLEDLAARRADAIWQYPYDRPHCYLLTNLEAYLDLYRATGDKRYLHAVQGGWELYRENWQNVGGSFSIKELHKNEPKSNPLYETLGETCGTAFWMLLNHRLHLLEPEKEVYIAEIEKSIYNVLLANQAGSEGIRYHTLLLGRKEAPSRVNTCCEGQGTRLLGSLPGFIYSLADDGLYINLFESSSIRWEHEGETIELKMQTQFPQSRNVRLVVNPAKTVPLKIRIRTPSWAAGIMRIELNGEHVATGTPGSYVVLDRTWAAGDTITFSLPIAFKLTQYTGVDQVAGRPRFSLEYGPLLMAVLGQAAETALVVRHASDAADLIEKLKPVKDKPLHFVIGLFESSEFLPYYEVGTEPFSCVPLIETTMTIL